MVNLGTRAYSISAIAFWAATAKLLVLDSSNPIWDEQGDERNSLVPHLPL